MKYLIVAILFTTPALAESCKDKFPGSTSSMPFSILKEYRDCLRAENRKSGVVVDYSTVDRSSDRLAAYEASVKVEQKREWAESERNGLIREQNKLLKRQIENEENFHDEVLDQLD